MSTAAALAQIHRWATASSAAIWMYQGLVPKLLGPHADELALSAAFGLAPEWQRPASFVAGMVELGMALCILLWRRQRWPHLGSALASVALLVFVIVCAPRYLGAAFNPVAMNLGLLVLSLIASISAPARRVVA